MSLKINLISLSAIAFLAGCASTPTEVTPTAPKSVSKIPNWILNPQVVDGIAVSECVTFSGNMSIDKQQAMAISRTSLAQRIGTKVNSMDKIYRDKVEVGENIETSATFSSVSAQLTQQTLIGTTLFNADIVDINNKANLCIMVGIGQTATKELFNSLVATTDRPMTTKQKDVLYAEFKAERAQDELEAKLTDLN